MGSINIDNTGSGGAITLSSDGTSLLLGGSAVGGGGADLYAANESSPTAQPSSTGANAISIGDSAAASGDDGFAIGEFVTASGQASLSMISNSTASGQYATSIGDQTVASGRSSIAMGYHGDATANFAVAIGNSSAGHGPQATALGAMALGGAKASGTDSFAVQNQDNSGSYGASQTSTIAIGYQAKASNTYAVAIGRTAIAQGDTSLALGEAQASGVRSVAIGTTTSSGKGSTGTYAIAIGYNSASTGTGSVCLGPENTSSSQYSVAIGRSNTASGNYAAVIGSRDSTASADNSFASGQEAKATIRGQKVHASGQFAAKGDAQGSTFILRADTTDATATVLTTNNSTASTDNQIIAASDTCITFDGTITAMQNGAQAYASWRIEGLLVNDGGTTTLANSATTVIQNLSSWGMALSADNTNNALAITVTGEASHNIRWVANIRTTEVTYA